jgi:putative transposase
VLRRLAESPSPLPSLAKDAALQLGLSCSSIYRLLRRYRTRPQVSSLLPMKRGRKRQSRFLDQAREKIIDAAIRDFFLKPERPRISDLMLAIRLACSEQNLHPANYRTVATKRCYDNVKSAVGR